MKLTYHRSVLALILLMISESLLAGNGLLIGLHYNNTNYRQTEQGITSNIGRELTVNTGQTVYGTSDNTPSTGAAILYTWGWDNGANSKAWSINLTSAGFENLTISFHQKSRIQLEEYGPRDFKLQYSTDGSTYSDVSGASYSLTDSWQKFDYSLPADCDDKTTVYLRWIMTSNISINNGTIASGALSDYADFFIYADEIPLPITDMALSNTKIQRNQPSGTTVGTFSVTDANVWDTYTYSLISGTGDENNGSFTIESNTLKTAAVLSTGSYSILVQADDGTYTFEESYTIQVFAYPIVTIGDPDYNSDAYLTQVQFGSIDKSSGMSGTNNELGYSDYTSESATVTRGTSVSLTITAQVVNSYGENLRAYIDWNRDYDLTDSGEQFDLLTGSSATGEISSTLSIEIPSDASLGSTLMRVVVDNYGTLALGGTDDYGEVEDYTINIQSPSSTITFTNGADATLNFEQSNAVPPVSNWLCGQFSLAGDITGATLNSVTVTLGGTYDSGDLESTPFQLYASSTNDFSTSSALGSSLADPGSGSDVTFTGLSDAIPASTRYYWITADISTSASGDDTMNGTIDAAGDLSITSGTLSGSSSYGKLNAGTDASLPVDLSSFSARNEGQSVILEWVTESETDNLGFLLERSVDGESWTTVASYQTNDALKGQGNISSKTEYSFTDTEVEPETTYEYRLSDVSTDGKITVYASLSIEVDVLPEVTAMEKAYPNPFNPSTYISYHLAEDSQVEIAVYDMLGRKVQTLFTGQQLAGSYNVYWHGKNEAGNIVPTGAYLIRMQTEKMAQVQKVLLIK